MLRKPLYWVHLEFGRTPFFHVLVTAVHDSVEGSFANHHTANALLWQDSLTSNQVLSIPSNFGKCYHLRCPVSVTALPCPTQNYSPIHCLSVTALGFCSPPVEEIQLPITLTGSQFLTWHWWVWQEDAYTTNLFSLRWLCKPWSMENNPRNASSPGKDFLNSLWPYFLSTLTL